MSRKFREVSTLQTASAYAHDLSYSVCNLNKVKGFSSICNYYHWANLKGDVPL